MKFVVGMKVWYVPRDSRIQKGREAIVTKVGRVWAYLNDTLRVDIETGECERDFSGQMHGMIYADEATYNLKLETARVWWEFRKAVQEKHRIGDITLDEIKEAAKILRIDVSP